MSEPSDAVTARGRGSTVARLILATGIATGAAACDRPVTVAPADTPSAAAAAAAGSDGSVVVTDIAALVAPERRGDGASAPGGGRPPPASVAAAPTADPPPLLDAVGEPLPSQPEAVPRDGAAMTLSRRYATATQAEALDARLQGRVVWVDVGGGAMGLDPIDLGVLVAYGQQAAQDLPDEAPILVRGADLRTAARVVDRLCEHGRRRVFLVTTP